MGPIAARTYPGTRLVPHTERARLEPDYGRRARGFVFGILLPHSGQAMTATYPDRTIASWSDFLEKAEQWVPEHHHRIVAILDNLSAHRAIETLLFVFRFPRWSFLFQPPRAAYLNLIEPWWKVLRSLALKGKRFETWQDVSLAIERATEYWNHHRHPFRWGQRRKRARTSRTRPPRIGTELTA